MMNYPQFSDDLQSIHASEVYGIALFESTARFTINKERKRKWLALKALEEKTLDRYLAYMRETNQSTIDPLFWRLKGYAEGPILAMLPYRFAMKLLSNGTASYQEKFLRLKQNAKGDQADFFAYVYAHEKAIEAFAKKERFKDPESLKAVESLLSDERSLTQKS